MPQGVFRSATWAVISIGTLLLAGGASFMAPVSGQPAAETSPIYGVRLPHGYRDWRVISVATVGGAQNDLRVKLGNDIAIRALRDGRTHPFPDGAIIARLAYTRVQSDEVLGALRVGAQRLLPPDQVTRLLSESFVAGAPTNVQFMVKDSRRYAASGGWGFAQFTNGHPDGEAVQRTCFACHTPARDSDFVFTRYAP